MQTTTRLSSVLPLFLLVSIVGCDKATAESEKSEAAAMADVAAQDQAEGEVETTAVTEIEIDPATLDLEAAAKLIETGEIETAEELEVALNDEERKLARVDVDVDGKVDPIHVVEARDEDTGTTTLELRAVPTSKLDAGYEVRVAELAFEPVEADEEVEFEARYTGSVQDETKVAYKSRVDVEFKGHVVVDARVPLVSWMFIIDRPTYYGVWVHEHRGVKVPPGHLKHGHWKATAVHHDDHDDGHVKIKFSSKHKGHDGHRGKTQVKIKHKGGKHKGKGGKHKGKGGKRKGKGGKHK